MRVISLGTLKRFLDGQKGRRDYVALKASVESWYAETKRARWQTSHDVKARYATASIVSAERVVFNIKGNDFRLVVSISYLHGIVWIKWIGTHKAYDRIDARSVEHEAD
ncbi:MAG TPA: type II toxin-antitoxin system HigB family toxin [Micropepsaceae bacterium]|nr:type II toxin-antitoxin system HigB family toxin [Micropepsaceae bacterium]